MSHCLTRMIEATTTNSYDFWYYQSLLEVPYTKMAEAIAEEKPEECLTN